MPSIEGFRAGDGAAARDAADQSPAILLVDDQPARLLTYESILEGVGVRCVRALSGTDALARLLESSFALILLDVSMPEMDGFETARMIRQHPRFEQTPIIFVTGVHITALDALKGYEAGAIDYISVPIVPEILRSKVKVLVELHQRQRGLDSKYADELAHQRQLYEAILTNTPDLAYVWGLDHRFVYANEGLLRMWGKTREQAIGRNCLELGYEPWHAAMHDREIDEIIATKKPIRGEVPFRGTFGLRHYDYLLVPVLGRNGEVVAVAGTTRDITELKQMEAALRLSDRRKDEFIAMLAHELRNPVAPIRSVGEILARTSTDERLLTLAGVIKRQTDQLSRLLDDLLEVARITQGQIELKRETVPLQACVKTAVETVEPLIKERRLRLIVTREEPAAFVNVDKVRITQCFVNLLTNAAKFTPVDGDIRVSVRIDDANAITEVEDTGVGISAELLPHIFDLFVQGRRSLDRPGGGLGIGLSVCKQLVEMHGGTVTGSSDGPGRGSKFAICLPLAANEAASPPSTARLGNAKRRVLVVDDNKDAADSLATLLQLDGHQVKAVYTAEDGLEEVRRLEPDLVLLDIGLPRMSGFEVVKRIKAAHPKVAVVALSGYGRPEDKRDANAAGFDAHLVKPVDFDTLRGLAILG